MIQPPVCKCVLVAELRPHSEFLDQDLRESSLLSDFLSEKARRCPPHLTLELITYLPRQSARPTHGDKDETKLESEQDTDISPKREVRTNISGTSSSARRACVTKLVNQFVHQICVTHHRTPRSVRG